MTLNEGLKAISMNPTWLVLTHITWPRNKYLQMSCATKKVGNISGIMDGPMTLKVVSTIDNNGYTEESFSRKNYKGKEYVDGWVILDNDTFVKRLLSKDKNGLNLDLNLADDIIVDMVSDNNVKDQIKVVLSENAEKRSNKFSEEQDVQTVTKYCENLLIPSDFLKSVVENLDNSDFPKYIKVDLYKEEILKFLDNKIDEETRPLFINKVLQKFRETFPGMFGLSPEDFALAMDI